ncbi:MAG: hypothetical protein AB7L09_00405 [Nitrospira sp.]
METPEEAESRVRQACTRLNRAISQLRRLVGGRRSDLGDVLGDVEVAYDLLARLVDPMDPLDELADL